MKENMIKNLTAKDDKFACALADKVILENKETDIKAIFDGWMQDEDVSRYMFWKPLFLIIFIVLFTIGVAAALFSYNREGFTGSRIKNPDSYLLDIERMNGTDLHTLDLQTGDILKIQFETFKGSLYMEIKAPDGTTIYSGDGKGPTDFTVNITESGVYTVVVEARHAKGGIIRAVVFS